MKTVYVPIKMKDWFDPNLLSMPPIDFRDKAVTLERVYLYIKNKLMRKARNLPSRKEKCEQLEKEFLEIYGRILQKEKELEKETEGKTKYRTQEPFYHFEMLDKKSERIFNGIRFKRN